MNKPNFTKIVNDLKTNIIKHSPEVLTGLGIVGMITTTVMAVKATPKALYNIKKRKKIDGVKKLKPKDVIKSTWECYMPATFVGVSSIACLVYASSIRLKRNAALATVYTLTESAFKEYQEKVIENIGEIKEREIKDSISKSQIEANPIQSKEIIITEKGGTLCYDPLSGRYFKSSPEDIKRAVNLVNKIMLDDLSASLNDFYEEIGLDYTDFGNVLGWDSRDGLLEITFSSQLASNDVPCLVMNYSHRPTYDYNKVL